MTNIQKIKGVLQGTYTVPVNSSAVSELTYRKRDRELRVTFTSGQQYRYGSVEPRTFKEFTDAESKGRFFQARIRDVYPYIRN